MVENYNMSRDVLLLHLPNRINEMAIVSKARFKCCFSHFASFSSFHVDNYGHNFMLENIFITQCLCSSSYVFLCAGRVLLPATSTESSGGRVRSENR